MSLLNKCQWLVCFVLAYCCVIAHGQEKVSDTQGLEFEISKELPRRPSNRIASSEATHFAMIDLRAGRTFRYGPGGWPGAILSTEAGESMSEKQRSFIAGFKKSSNRHFGPFAPKGGGGIVHFYINAVSENDARKMVEALFEYFNKKAQSELEAARNQLKQARNIIIEKEKELPAMVAQHKSIKAKADNIMEDHWGTKNLLIDKNSIVNDIRENMKVFKHKLRNLDFENVNTQARIEAINKFKNKGKITDQSNLVKLDQMLIDDEVKLAGLLAEQRVIRDTLRQAKNSLHTIGEKNKLSKEVNKLRKTLADNKTIATNLEAKLADLPAEWKPVSIPNRKVVIYDIRRN